jgi:exopolysaccharide production protein ExoQ
MARIATVGCLLLIALLFWTDVKKREDRPISWLPLMWMFLAGSRWVSSWLNLSAPLSSIDDYAEGSPVDRAVFLALIVWGLIVLYRRNIAWGRLLRENKWIVLYFLYCLSSIIWTDEPFILLKRWIKDLGNPIVALVMLTEQRPYEAVGITLRRLAFLLLPLSVLFLRYYPDLGRAYHGDGTPMFTGVGHQKNDLGLMCLTAGMYLFWKLLQKRTGSESAEKSDGFDLLLIAMLVWLLRMSDSQTSFSCLATAVTVLVLSRVTFISKKPSRIIGVLAVVAVSLLALQATFDVKTIVLGLLGRDPTLTGRSELWEVVSTLQVNPLVGAGFMSFWSGQRMAAIWRALGPGINQAHSGYLEQYLNLGYIGVAFIAMIMVSAMFNLRKQLNTDPSAGMLRLCFLTAAALYNYTEASFYGVNNMWVLMLVASIDTSALRSPKPLAVPAAAERLERNDHGRSRWVPRAQVPAGRQLVGR